MKKEISEENIVEEKDNIFSNNMSTVKESKKFLCVSLLKSGPSKIKSNDPNEFSDTIKKSEVSWVDCKVNDLVNESKKIADRYNFNSNLIEALIESKYSAYEDFDKELGLTLPAIRVQGLDVEVNKLLILMKENLIITIHTERVTRTRMFAKYAESFLKKIPTKKSREDKVSLVLIRILDENSDKNFEGLRKIEEESDEINKLLIDPKTPRIKISSEIYRMKHALITYLNALWASVDVIHSLRYGDAELITDDKTILVRMTVLSKDLTMHISLSEHMSEVLASGMEVMQSIYNNQLQVLNNRLSLMMVWLTIFGTAVLVPNTLGTIYGIPQVSEHLKWHTILYSLILSSVLSGLIVYYYIKSKKMIPEKVE
ncbi:MAG: CorA family divalent cation transporter [archaeon]